MPRPPLSRGPLSTEVTLGSGTERVWALGTGTCRRPASSHPVSRGRGPCLQAGRGNVRPCLGLGGFGGWWHELLQPLRTPHPWRFPPDRPRGSLWGAEGGGKYDCEPSKGQARCPSPRSAASVPAPALCPAPALWALPALDWSLRLLGRGRGHRGTGCGSESGRLEGSEATAGRQSPLQRVRVGPGIAQRPGSYSGGLACARVTGPGGHQEASAGSLTGWTTGPKRPPGLAPTGASVTGRGGHHAQIVPRQCLWVALGRSSERPGLSEPECGFWGAVEVRAEPVPTGAHMWR